MTPLNALFLLSHINAFTEKCSIYDSPCITSLTQNYATLVFPGGTGLGFEPLDPMSLPSIKGEKDGLFYALSEIEIVGVKHSLIEKVQFNKKDRRAYLKMRIPCLTVFANYTAIGNIQKVPFNGEGKLIFKIYNFENELTSDYEVIKGQNGKDYIKYNNYLYWYDLHYFEPYLENINKDDPTLGIQVHEFLKRESRKVLQQYGRYLFDNFNDKIFKILQKFDMIQPVENILIDY